MAHVVGVTEDAAPDELAPGRAAHGLPDRIDVALLGVIVLAAFLRFWRIGAQSLWFDEYLTTVDVSHGLGRMLFTTLGHVEGTPPLYYVLEWGWVRVVGHGDAAVRSLSAVFGIATVPMAYLVARRLHQSARVARIVALLVAVSPLFVWFSQEARSYALLVFLASVSLYFCARAVEAETDTDFLLWGLASAAALATHYFAAFLIVPEAVWLLLAHRPWRRVALGALPIVVAAVPLLVLAEVQSKKHNWIADWPLSQRLAETGRQLLLGIPEPLDHWWPLVAALLVAPIVLVVWRGRPRERSTALVMSALVVGGLVLALLLAAIGTDLVLGRYLIALVLPLFLAAAIGFGARRAGWVGVAAALALCALWTGLVVDSATGSTLHKPDWRAVSKVLATGGGDRVVVVDDYLGQPLLRYAHHPDVVARNKTVRVRRIDLLYHVPPPKQRCGRWSGLACEVFFFPLLPKSLQPHFLLVAKIEFDGFTLNRYAAAQPVPVRPRQLLSKGRFGGMVYFPNGR